MHFVKQETKNGCGAAVIAMLGNLSFEEGVEVVGKSGLTTTKDIKNALAKLGYKTANKLERAGKNKELPSLCIIKTKNDSEGMTHWSVYKKGKFYDPTFGVFRYNFYPDKGGRIISFLKIFTEEE